MNLPKWLTDVLTTIILPLAKLVGKNGLVEMFKNMKEKNINTYISVLTIGYRALKVHIKPLADTTATNWDNEAIEIVVSAIEKSAQDNDVVLPDVTIHPELPHVS
jgi:hypothetical protein